MTRQAEIHAVQIDHMHYQLAYMAHHDQRDRRDQVEFLCKIGPACRVDAEFVDRASRRRIRY